MLEEEMTQKGNRMDGRWAPYSEKKWELGTKPGLFSPRDGEVNYRPKRTIDISHSIENAGLGERLQATPEEND